eukprot:TRINITY_DN409_c0_g1_i7.p1 TRINITY_DN409_c0_g1~~TRINITY_DN409_c0_g1_i7.p1  ORF type:complete len:238 (-),score=48.35 TRINITY_DN409_c0_g1_i7:191-829(-)
MARFINNKFLLLALSLISTNGETEYMGSRGQRVSAAAMQTGLEDLASLQELGGTISTGITNELRIARNFALLKDEFEGTPKQEDGKIGVQAVRTLLATHFSKLSSRTISTAELGHGSADETTFDLHQTAVLATVLESDEWMQQVGGDVAAAAEELLNILDTDNQPQSEHIESEQNATWVAPTWSVFFIISSALVLLARSVGKKSAVAESKMS